MDPEDLAVYDQIMAPKYVELHGEGTEASSVWRHPYNEAQNRPYGYGIFLDWAYAQFGAYSMSTELWNWARDTRGLPGYNGEDDRNVWYQGPPGLPGLGLRRGDLRSLAELQSPRSGSGRDRRMGFHLRGRKRPPR